MNSTHKETTGMKTTGEIDMDEIIRDAHAALVADDYAHAAYGFRMLPRNADHYAAGDRINTPSKVWYDNEITDTELPGVSVIMIDFAADDSIESVIIAARTFQDGNYLGMRVALVAGDVGDNGEDPGEIIISTPAAVLAAWDV